MEQLTKKNSILYNQEWINKAIEEGHMDFIPVHKFPNKSIGEHIEIKYNQLYNEEFDKHLHNGTLEEYKHFINESPKVTKRESLLFIRECIKKAREEGIPLPNRRISLHYNIGEIMELHQYQKDVINPLLEKKQKLSSSGHCRKKMRK